MNSEVPRKKPTFKAVDHGPDVLKDGYVFIRKGSGRIQKFRDGNLEMETLTHGTAAKEIKAAVVTAEPGVCSDDTEIYFGEKWFYVLEGTLEMLVNDQLYILNEGDSIYLEPTAIHTWRNTKEGRMKALVFSSPCPMTADAEVD
jgi:quercetin dioxygenase-like cupin family protein